MPLKSLDREVELPSLELPVADWGTQDAVFIENQER